MRFQFKLLFVYLTISILIIGLVSSSLYIFDSKILEENAKNNLQEAADRMISQIDNNITWADYTMAKLIEDEAFKSDMTLLQNYRNHEGSIDGTENSNYLSDVNNAHQHIRSMLFKDSINQHFYRVSVFNIHGDYFTSSYARMDGIDIENRIKSLDWLSRADNSMGNVKNRVVIPTYLDPWEEEPKTKVFSIARHIPTSNPKYGGRAGYIEIQIAFSELDNFFGVNKDEGQSVVAFIGEGDYLYAKNISEEQLNFYRKKLNNNEKNFKNPYTGEEEFLVSSSSEYSTVNLLLIQNKNTLLHALFTLGRFTLIVILVSLLVTLVLTAIISNRLTFPLRKLKVSMEEFDLNNSNNFHKKDDFNDLYDMKSKDEIKALNAAFNQLRTRLIVSMENELRAQALQMTANFDSLQSQINPHFLYNILNVLSSKGIEMDDFEICEICDGIAAMLRYTTTKDSVTTIKDETEHVRNYLNLLKKRFESDLFYDVDISEALAQIRLPKLVLQPLVENAINHGYEKINRMGMYVCIMGRKNNDGYAFTIFDNGQGFEQAVLEKIRAELSEVKEKLENQTESLSFSIGGMGLVNTFARLWLFFKGNISFEVGNLPQKGAYVKISIFSIYGDN